MTVIFVLSKSFQVTLHRTFIILYMIKETKLKKGEAWSSVDKLQIQQIGVNINLKMNKIEDTKKDT